MFKRGPDQFLALLVNRDIGLDHQPLPSGAFDFGQQLLRRLTVTGVIDHNRRPGPRKG